MDHFKFKHKNLLWQYVIGSFALIVGIITLFKDLKGLVPLFIGIYLWIQEGVEINLKQSVYRKTKSLFGIALGKWQPLPKIDYVSVFKTSETTTVWAASASANVTNAIIKVNLFYDTNQKLEIYNSKNLEDAFLKAKQIATALDIDILDATSRESKWL